jgi:cytochrome c-type biogenesis protein CcsB
LRARQSASRLPKLEVIDDVMYKTIAIGFAFFTIATILGAMWAAEAWGGYWSWDPKETWALIVWLNYAAWLHIRLVKGLRGPMLAWWAVVGLFVTIFAFIGVNMFLSRSVSTLHSTADAVKPTVRQNRTLADRQSKACATSAICRPAQPCTKTTAL